MKFLCPSCKAKYQIADEKVAGRSVRMKCRKCGHEIKVSSADAQPSSTAPPPPVEGVAEPFPKEPAPSAKAPAVAAPAVSAPVVSAPVVSAPAASAPNKPAPPDKAKPAFGTRAPAPAKPTTGPVPSVTSKPAVPAPRPPPKPAGLSQPRTGPVPRVASKPLTSAASLKVQPSSPSAKQGATLTPSPAPARAAEVAKPAAAAKPAPAPRDENGFGDEEEEQTRIADTSALAGAFSAAVSQAAPHSVSDPLSMPGDEWFVGINGVPVGPIRLSELRSKAAAGSITKESLVWRDGFEEWRPLKSFPELVAIVEESLSSARTSLAPMAPGPRPGGVESISDPFAGTVPLPVGSPSSGAVTGAAVVTDDLEAAGIRRRGRTPFAAWIMLAIAVPFGILIGMVFFSKQKTEVKIVEVPAKAPEPVTASSAAEAVAAEEPTEVKDSKGTRGPITASKNGQPKPDADSKLTGGLKGLGLQGLAAGPKGPAGTQTTGSTGGGQLDSTQISQVVSRYTPSVKRSCWQPAIDTRDKDAPGSARVMVSITIGGSGSVQNVSTTGDPKGYRGLANCIAGRVRGWQFPPSSGTTPVNVPFVFVAQ